MATLEHRVSAGRDDEKLGCRRSLRPPEHRRGDVTLAGFAMRLSQVIGQRHADRAHGNVDGIAAKRGKRAAVSEHDALNRRVVGEHRDENFALAGVGNAVGDLRTLAREGFSLAVRAIVDDEMMASL